MNCAGVVLSLCPPVAPWFISSVAAGGGLKAQAQPPPTVGFLSASGGGSASPGPRGHCFRGALSLVPCDVQVAAGQFAAPRPRATLPALCSAGAAWRPRAPGAARGASSWRVSPCRCVRPCAVRRWRPVKVPPSASPGERAAGGGGGTGGQCLSGEPPWAAGPNSPLGSFSGPGPMGARLSFWPSPTVPLLPALEPPRGAVLRGGGGGRSWVLGAAARASGRWSPVSGSQGLHCRARLPVRRRRRAPTSPPE